MTALASIEDIQNHLDNIDLDVRKSGNGRWIDQKVTPDVLSLTAESILLHMENSKDDTFTMRSLWNDEIYAESTKIFNKPDVNNDKANNEYDKLISQPCLTLAYAKIISKDPTSNRNIYSLNENISILRYIAHRSDNAYKFLCVYLTKVLKDSDLWPTFENFLNRGANLSVSTSDYKYLKDSFSDFEIKYTKINGITETRRIFTKVINPLAAQYGVKGTKGGFLSKHNITWSDLLYNQINFRDIKKEKNLTRQESEDLIDASPIQAYQINKAIKQVRSRHILSEMGDEDNGKVKTQVHHIFMKHEKPELASHLENLINLTPNQHSTKAHPEMNFHIVDPTYQKLCLFKKCDAVQESNIQNDSFYSKEKLIEVINGGFNESIVTLSQSFNDIKSVLDKFYLNRFEV